MAPKQNTTYRPIRILVVDEDSKTLKIARVFLANQGYEVEAAATEKSAFRSLLNSFFDVVLLNIHAVEYDAPAFAKELQIIWPFQKIILTAEKWDTENRSTARELNISQMLTKPISIDKLNKSIQKVCKLPSRGGAETVAFHERDLSGELTTLQKFTGQALEHLNYTRTFRDFVQGLFEMIPCRASGMLGITDLYQGLFVESLGDWTDEIAEPVVQNLEMQIQSLTGESLLSPLSKEIQVHPEESNRRTQGRFCHLTAPVRGEEGELKAILFVVLPGKPEDNETEIEALYLAAHHLSTLLEAFGHIRKRTMWDAITGLPNRAYLDQSTPRIWTLANSNQHALALLMIDLDGFTPINREYGYFTGDLVMKEVAEIMQSQTMATDLLVRLQGDRFLILLTNAEQKLLTGLADKIYKAVSDHSFRYDGHTFKLSITLAGVLSGEGSGISSSEQMMDCANQVMVRLKKAGGDQVGFWENTSTAEDYQEYSRHPVLLVDDDPAVSKLINKILASEMVDITSTASVDEAEALLQQGNRYEIMITDISMQERDGFEMLKVADQFDPEMVKVATSGNISKKTEQLLKDAGSFSILRKPFQLQEIRNQFSIALEHYAQNQRKK